MTEAIGQRNRRFWRWFTMVAFTLFVLFSVFSYMDTTAHPGLRPGRPLPELLTTTIAGEEWSLMEAAVGRRAIMIVSPTCDICAGDMMEMVEAFESASMDAYEEPEQILWLILQSEGMPRSVFMEAYRRGIELGIGLTMAEAGAGRDLGVTRVPVTIALNPDGTIASVSYPRETSERQ
ncbi:hypothetical protein ACFL44_00510 [Gemmatimonadota bacterium]